ncbi:MAG: 3-hydroxyacyl-ACP dehydratase FabZ [Legionellales bacterium]|nr:3-hydroxyacyl-ACP dehydratase FabZ [Legionellales bacterium]
MDHLDINEIFHYLPQRYPFLLIDRVIDLKIEESVTAVKNVTINENFFNGHFPKLPVMPGVLLIEALAQASGILALKSAEHRGLEIGGIYYFAAIDNVRFKKPVVPGDQLILDVKLIKSKNNVWKFSGEAKVDGNLVCNADLTSVRRDS